MCFIDPHEAALYERKGSNWNNVTFEMLSLRFTRNLETMNRNRTVVSSATLSKCHLLLLRRPHRGHIGAMTSISKEIVKARQEGAYQHATKSKIENNNASLATCHGQRDDAQPISSIRLAHIKSPSSNPSSS